MANTINKPVQSIINTQSQVSVFQTLNGSGLTYTLCDRTLTTSKQSNFFESFNLPYISAAFSTGSTLSLTRPELQQLNVDKIIVIPIPQSYYSETIDGRSVTFTVPQYSGSSNPSISSVTVVSSTYSSLQTSSTDPLIGSNIAFLFSDTLNLPYTGTTNGGISAMSSHTTWNTSLYTKRPAATSYLDLQSSDINTDKRPLSAISYSVGVGSQYPTNFNQGYNYDIAVGVLHLDSGFAILTHPTLVNGIPFTLGQNLYTNSSNAGPGSGTTNIYFSGSAKSQITLYDLDTQFQTTAVCLALPAEFFISTNNSYPLSANISQLNNNTNNFTPIYITEIGLYNINGEMIANCKLSEPLLKTYTSLITFNLVINI